MIDALFVVSAPRPAVQVLTVAVGVRGAMSILETLSADASLTVPFEVHGRHSNTCPALMGRDENALILIADAVVTIVGKHRALGIDGAALDAMAEVANLAFATGIVIDAARADPVLAVLQPSTVVERIQIVRNRYTLPVVRALHAIAARCLGRHVDMSTTDALLALPNRAGSVTLGALVTLIDVGLDADMVIARS